MRPRLPGCARAPHVRLPRCLATGLYGILSRSVTERRREIGIRMALGARRQQIVSTLARGTALRILTGVIAGAVLAAAAGRFLQSLLYGVSAGSPFMALATLAVLFAVLTLAFVFPAGRAASVDPMEAIRDEKGRTSLLMLSRKKAQAAQLAAPIRC